MSDPNPINDPIGYHITQGSKTPPLFRDEYEAGIDVDDLDDDDFDDDDEEDWDEDDDDDFLDDVDLSPGIDYKARAARLAALAPTDERQVQIREAADELFQIVKEARHEDICLTWADALRRADKAIEKLERLAYATDNCQLTTDN